MAKFDLNNFLPYQVNVLASRMSRNLEARYRSKFGISVAEWRILAHLSQAGSVSTRDIQRRVDMHKSRVSRAAKRLQSSGYITKTPNSADRRVFNLALTGKGRDIVGEIAPIASQYQGELLATLGERGQSFRDGLNELLENGR